MSLHREQIRHSSEENKRIQIYALGSLSLPSLRAGFGLLQFSVSFVAAALFQMT